MPVKEFLKKSVNIWYRYKQKFGGMFFDSRWDEKNVHVLFLG